VKWFERGGQDSEEEVEYQDDVLAKDIDLAVETATQLRKRIKGLKAGSENFESICKKAEEKPEASCVAASGSDQCPCPKPVWKEIKACLSEIRADLICIKLNKETVVDPSLWHCRHVNNLKLRMPPGILTQLPPDLAHLKSLTTLIVCHNSLTSLPDELSKLLLLKNLDFSDNELEKLPDAIQSLEHLEVVDACRNSLQASPPPQPLPPYSPTHATTRLTECPVVRRGAGVGTGSRT
jgi:Leucine-rich repeat (LRR) protein